MSDLVTWLRQQLEEDVQIARAAARAFAALGTEAVAEWLPVMLQTEHSSRVDEHIARWDPARVLAEVAAKRRILDLHRSVVIGGDGAEFFAEAPGCLTCDPAKSWPCPTLRALALPYADQPGYDESWRP